MATASTVKFPRIVVAVYSRGWNRATTESGHAPRPPGQLLERDHVLEVAKPLTGGQAQACGYLPPLIRAQLRGIRVLPQLSDVRCARSGVD